MTYKAIRAFEDHYGIALQDDEEQAILEGCVEEDFAATGTQDRDYIRITVGPDGPLGNPLYYLRAENHFMTPPSYGALSDGGWLLEDPSPTAVWATTDGRNLMRYEAALELASEDRLRAFRALGHVLHLIEDMTVPAHVRNDAHIMNKDNYERMLQGRTPAELEALMTRGCAEGAWCRPVEFDSNLVGSPSPYLRAEALVGRFRELAQFTASNFYSDDTLFDGRQAGLALEEPSWYDGDGYVYNADLAPAPRIAHQVLGPLYDIDDAVVDDSFAFLAPEAIRYGAGLIHRFIRDALPACVEGTTYCGPAVDRDDGVLYRCSGGRLVVERECELGCEQRLPGAPDRCVPRQAEVWVAPNPANLSADDCVDQGGTGFPAGASVTLVFEDVRAGMVSRSDPVVADEAGDVAWLFGLRCLGAQAADAEARALAFLARVDPQGQGFDPRPMRHWAEYWDGGLVRTATVDYALSGDPSCVPTCDGAECGPDGCGGTCEPGCGGWEVCTDGACVQPAGGGITVCGDLLGEHHWTAADSPVLVTCDVELWGTLRIDPGVVVRFRYNSSRRDLRVRTGGRLLAEGDADNPIVFTSEDRVVPSSWGGVDIYGDSIEARLLHVSFRYGGGTSGGAGFPILASGRASLQVEGVSFVDNRRDAIGLRTGLYTEDLDLDVVGVPYYVDQGDVVVSAGVTLRIAPGVVVKFEEDAACCDFEASDLIVQGRLLANGTDAQPIVLTSYRDDAWGGDSNADGSTAPGSEDWGGVHIEPDPTGLGPSELHNVLIAYAGEQTNGTGFPIRVRGTSRPIVQDVTLRHNRRNAIGLIAGAYAEDSRLDVVGLPYYVEQADIIVNAGVTLTVDPGVVIKLEEDAACCDYEASDILVYGRLLARGTPERPVAFTSYRDDAQGGDSNNDGSSAPAAEDWGGLYLARDSTGLRRAARPTAGPAPRRRAAQRAACKGCSSPAPSAWAPSPTAPRPHPSSASPSRARSRAAACAVPTTATAPPARSAGSAPASRPSISATPARTPPTAPRDPAWTGCAATSPAWGSAKPATWRTCRAAAPQWRGPHTLAGPPARARAPTAAASATGSCARPACTPAPSCSAEPRAAKKALPCSTRPATEPVAAPSNRCSPAPPSAAATSAAKETAPTTKAAPKGPSAPPAAARPSSRSPSPARAPPSAPAASAWTASAATAPATSAA